jgi:glycosyltransferase involved in cell wall biosynthesis
VPIEILPNGVAMPDVAARAPLAASGQTILFLGRLGRRKGTYELVEAFGRIASEFPNARLICAGDGEVAPFREIAADFEISDRVEFPGWTSLDQTRGYLASSAIFALPSHAEGLPMALLEAMSWQLAVVVSSVGGIPRVVHDNDNGLLMTAGDIDELTAALRKLLSDSALRDRLALAARITVEDGYSLNATVHRLARIYARFGLAPKEVLSA